MKDASRRGCEAIRLAHHCCAEGCKQMATAMKHVSKPRIVE